MPNSKPSARKEHGSPVDQGDLKAVRGIGPKVETRLKRAGIKDLDQLARTPVNELAALLSGLHGKFDADRIVRERWLEQAAALAAVPGVDGEVAGEAKPVRHNHPIVVHGQRGFSLHPRIDLWLDAEAFDEALCAARKEPPDNQDGALTWYEEALQLYRGELLEDAPFEEWALLPRERLRLKYLDALDQVARLRFAAGRYTDCLDACERLIPGDLCREEVHRLMMRCYTRLNQPHLAVRQYHQCERQLRDELEIEPAQATQQLYERIRRRELV